MVAAKRPIRICPGRRATFAAMPELPEVEITTRRLNSTLAGTHVESALAPGMVTMKTYDPPLSALTGLEVVGVRRIGKMPVVEFGDVALLVHLMSAGRLQVFDARASLRDKASRLLIRIDDGRELRLREFGTRQRAWAKLLSLGDVERDEAVAKLGPEAWPAPAADELAEALRHGGTCCCGTSARSPDRALLGRRDPVDGAAEPVREGRRSIRGPGRAAARRVRRTPGRSARALRAGDRRHGARQAPDASPGTPACRGRVRGAAQRSRRCTTRTT